MTDSMRASASLDRRAAAWPLVLAVGAACHRPSAPAPPARPWPEPSVAAESWSVHRPQPRTTDPPVMATWLAEELDRHVQRLAADDMDPPAHHLAYDVVGTEQLWIEAEAGVLLTDDLGGDRLLDVDVRVGSPELDNGHAMGGEIGPGQGLGSGSPAPLDDVRLALSQAVWAETERQYRQAITAYAEIRSDVDLRAEDGEAPDPDFSSEAPVVAFLAPPEVDFAAIRTAMRPTIRRVSVVLAEEPRVLESRATLEVVRRHRIFVDSGGTRVTGGSVRTRIVLEVHGQAEDGMRLSRTATFEGRTPDDLPDLDILEEAARVLREELVALLDAPLAEPYTGPALLDGRSAAVFFHEIVGHRLEGHRQKIDEEGQTLAGKVGKRILPWFIDIVDDPTIDRIGDVPLWGHYLHDAEGMEARRVELVTRGKLQTFLLSRSPVGPFEHSNGHGRREPGYPVVARQGNLIVRARKRLRRDQLREALLDEVRRQKKPYGLWIREAESGYTLTDRLGPQAFKVNPTLVYRVYADGRPDELIRGADLVGTPLSAFEDIVAAGDRSVVFNGMCGAESGWVPVSAVSPSILLRSVEIERASHDRDRPPLLPPPKDGSP
ncbi:MAG: peptidase U62 [Deltaproteobacteria bacterium]|nr:MAG: peptidase U62 [Deltaproteobacteria bacterium]